ncbi:MAG: hypothetical protein QXV32_02060 [Conexivisphaerales archaeon]
MYLSYVGIRVTDLQKSAEFYKGLFDLPVLPRLRELRLTISNDTDPHSNLSHEETILRSVEDGRSPNTLWVWKNEECLVGGRVRSPRYGWYDEELAKRLGYLSSSEYQAEESYTKASEISIGASS